MRVEALAGDGSTRCFYRLHASKQTYVVLFDREWIFSKDYPAHQAYLAQCDIPVPDFLEADPDQGCLVMQDLGDELLQHRILAEPESKMDWLRQATSLLAHLHGKTFPVPPELPVSTRSFDRKKYFDEMLYTEEHLMAGYLKLPRWTPSERSEIEAFCGRLAEIPPPVFAHRDYHTRNLLVAADELYMIDFQDARLGPPHYDLASLLYDAYVPVSEEEKRELTDLYLSDLEMYPELTAALRLKTFTDDLERTAFQRVVKAAGSFASFFTRNGKKTHLPYLRPALESARELQKNRADIPRAFAIERWLEALEDVRI
jgi:aminoglycoside/choline kinase family phosphotransferase